MTYDVIIVGAGPAGAAAAYWLGEAGWRVLVLEKDELPRYKPCGGGVPRTVFDQFPLDFSTVVESWVQRVRFRYRDGRQVAVSLPHHAVAMVMRDRFDSFLLKHAQADVQDQTCVEGLEQNELGVTATTTSGEAFRGRYLIGADGAHSRVAQLVRLRENRQMGMAVEAEVPAESRLVRAYAGTALFLFGVAPKGYLWIFPKTDHLSLGIGTLQGQIRDMKSILHREMAKLGVQIDDVRLRGHPLPIHVRRELLRRGRVTLVGDAAGLVDPLLGEGIRHAIASARLAAECLSRNHLAAYSQRIHQEIGRDLLWARCAAQVFYRLPGLSFELGVRNPLFIEGFLRILAGETSYRKLVLRALPKTLFGLSKRLSFEHSVNQT